MLKVEVSGAKSRKSMGADREATPGYTGKRGKKGKHSSDDDDDDDDLIDDEPDEAVPEENDEGVTAEEMLAEGEVIESMNADLEVPEPVTPLNGVVTNGDCVRMFSKGSGASPSDASGASQIGL